MADEEKRNWMSCLGWGCLVVVVVSVLGIGGCVAYVYKGGSAAHAAADAYLEAVDGGQYEEAFQALGPSYTADRELAEFVAFEQAARAQMGACGAWRMSGTSFNRVSGHSVAMLTYQSSCDGGPVEAVFNLEQLDGQWVVQDVRYQEPGVTVIPVCAECGAVVPPGANFCAGCGAAVGGDAAADEGPSGEDEPSE
jgi:zinc-ribbon domain